MQGTAQLETFAADPVGRYLVAPSWIHFCAHAGLFGVVLWGRPTEDEIARLVRSLAVELGDEVAPHQSLVDARRVQNATPEAFNLLNRYVRDHHDALARQVTRLALVRPEGLAGAVAAGFYEVLDAPYPVTLFDGAAAALAWLDPAADPGLLDELDRARAEMTGVPPLVATLRLAIRERPGAIDLAGAARSLGLSERSLQRHLRAAGTTFVQQLADVRIGEAKRRMVDTDEPLTRIALDLGFTSLAHFSAQFRKRVGEAPSSWRRRHG
jgi:AraC-like DNA-binding protein